MNVPIYLADSVCYSYLTVAVTDCCRLITPVSTRASCTDFSNQSIKTSHVFRK
ncbi:hypothetical protein [Methanimicrococcus blatticola]|uniref:hypothetical protein n=1 Tax=Methanimicrococcus blatticola TaxID=91560 RepID=UPI0014152610|nr:hypothetical protein [Methanimicrococcus blatticola]MBZ3935875.1 hypothetical protein [Methanimicrococcus blatticola]MCC2508004.1 hypothetical protein [Methanimicrococcus blatticola]